MFRNKIAWLALLAILPMSLPALASDTQQEKKILTDRANYWDRQGRGDMAVQAWEQLLLVDPDNVQALAGLARHQAKSAPELGAEPEGGASSTVASADSDAAVQTQAVAQPHEPVRKVEDWADLYPDGLKAQPDGTDAEQAGAPQGHDVSSGQAETDQAVDMKAELTADPGSQLPEAQAADAGNQVEVAQPHTEQSGAAEPAVIVEPQPDSMPVAMPQEHPEAPAVIVEPQPDKIANDAADTPAVQSDTGVVSAATSQPDSTPVAMPHEQPDTQGMMARAQYWEKTGRSDMAAQAWQQLLLADPDNVQAQAGLAWYQLPPETQAEQPASETQAEQPALAHPDNLESGKAERDVPASAEAAAAAVSESAQHAAPEPVVEVQPEGDGKKVEDWADLYQSGLKEGAPTERVPMQADDQPPSASPMAMNGREQAVEQPVPVEPIAANAIDAAAPDVLTRVETGRAPGVTLRAPYEAAPPEKWREFYQRGIKPALPESETDPTTGGSLLVSEQPSRQELLDQAQYWDSRGRADLSAKIRKDLSPQPAVVMSGKPDVVEAEIADKPKLAVSSKPETQVAAEPAITTAENRQGQPQVTLEENVQALVAQPSRQELLERTQYWEERGRSDLAAKVPDQPALVVSEQGNAVPGKDSAAGKRIALAEKVIARSESASQAQLGTSEPGMAQAGAAPGKQELEEQAAYWEARGRSDLASKARPTVAGSGRDAAIASADRSILAVDSRTQSVSGVPAHGRTALSREELDEQAQYWEARGRSDLADQLRNKLYTLEPARPAGIRAAPLQAAARDDVDARSALENSLLKNPGSMSARLNLAKIYQSAGEMAKARLQIDSVLTAYPDLPDALYASAQLYATQRLWWETLHTLDRISPVSRTAEMGKLQKMAWAHVQIDRADALVRQGNNAEAELLLRQVAAELAVSYNQTRQPEPPPLWKSTAPKSKKARR